MLNPGWGSPSDFGFFAKKKATAALTDFVETYSLTTFTCKARTAAVLRAWPGPWQIFLQTSDSDALAKYARVAVLDTGAKKPSYSRCEQAITEYLASELSNADTK